MKLKKHHQQSHNFGLFVGALYYGSAVSKLKSIDLFAGCGGLSLGLEQAGFETVFVNELHPDAMKTFLQNLQ